MEDNLYSGCLLNTCSSEGNKDVLQHLYFLTPGHACQMPGYFKYYELRKTQDATEKEEWYPGFRGSVGEDLQIRQKLPKTLSLHVGPILAMQLTLCAGFGRFNFPNTTLSC